MLIALLGIAVSCKKDYTATFPIGHAVEVKGNHDNFEPKDWVSDSGVPFHYPAYVKSLDLKHTTPEINFYVIRAADSADWYMDVTNLKDLGDRP